MTCIAGLVTDEGAVWMGADAAATSGYDVRILSGSKIVRVDNMLIGTSGSVRVAQIIRYNLSLPEHNPDRTNDEAYLVGPVMDAVRQTLKAAGHDRKDEGEDEQNSWWLLGYRGHLYTVYSDFSIGSYIDPFAAVGCGANYALGALHATDGQDPSVRLGIALEAASRFNAGVCRPFTIMRLGGS